MVFNFRDIFHKTPKTAIKRVIWDTFLRMGHMLQQQPIDIKRCRKSGVFLGKTIEFLQPIPKNVDILKTSLAGVPCWNIPYPSHPSKTIFYLHGGGYVCGLEHLGKVYQHFMVHLGMACSAEVWALDYRLAPEHPFPAMLDDSFHAYLDLLHNKNVHPSEIFMVGDSAGGGLTLALLLKLRDKGLPLPQGVVTLSPWTDLTISGESVVMRAHKDPMLKAQALPSIANCVVKNESANNPYISPLFGNYKGLPPLMMIVGGQEALYDDTIRVAQKAKNAGVDVSLHIYEEMFHIFPVFSGIFDEGKEVMDRIAAFVQAHE